MTEAPDASRALRKPWAQAYVPARVRPARQETHRMQTLNANLWGPHTLFPQTQLTPGHTLNPRTIRMGRDGRRGASVWGGGPRNLRLPRARCGMWGNPSREGGSERAFIGVFRDRPGG